MFLPSHGRILTQGKSLSIRTTTTTTTTTTTITTTTNYITAAAIICGNMKEPGIIMLNINIE